MINDVGDQTRFNGLARHITQSWEWGEFRRQTPTVVKVRRLGSFAKGKLQKVFQVFFHRVPFLPVTVAYLPRSEFPNREELAELKTICHKEKAIFIKIEPVNELTDHPINKSVRGVSILPPHTIYINLALSEKELLSQMHPKTRYNINLATKKGVIIKSETNPEGLEKFLEILIQTEKRQGFYSHNPAYYRLLWKALSPHHLVHVLTAYLPPSFQQSSHHILPTAPVAAMMLFNFQDFLFYPYGGSNPEFREFMAPYLLHWEAIRLGKKLGCRTYDLWGSYRDSTTESDPWWGLYRFKKGFGGQEITFASVDIPLNWPFYLAYRFLDPIRWALLRMRR